jgi:hypothetical protein
MRVLGRATIKFDGRVLLTNKGAKLNTGGVERKTVEGDVVHGYAEEVKAPFVECEVSVTKDTSLMEYNNITDATVTFECDTGQIYVLRNAWSEKPSEATGGDGGKVPLRLVGMSCEEMF